MRRARGRIECSFGSDDFLHRVAEKSRKTDERAENENNGDDDPSVQRLAERARTQRIGGEEVPFDGQRECDHDTHLTEVVGQRHVELRFEAREHEEDVLVPNVVATHDGERRDADQREHVSDGQTSQVRVRRLLETALKENAQIEYIADDAEYTNGENDVSIAGDFDVVQCVGIDGLISVENARILAHGAVREREVLLSAAAVRQRERNDLLKENEYLIRLSFLAAVTKDEKNNKRRSNVFLLLDFSHLADYAALRDKPLCVHRVITMRHLPPTRKISSVETKSID